MRFHSQQQQPAHTAPYRPLPNTLLRLPRCACSARLELIKNVAGTHVYEERRAESLRILEHSDAQRAQIHEVRDSAGAPPAAVPSAPAGGQAVP
jgi:hypothetical protein